MFTNYREALPWDTILSGVVFLEVKMASGDLASGTAFHIGQGYFATARHNIEGNEVIRVGQSDFSQKTSINPDGGISRITTHPAFELPGKNITDVFFHNEPTVDVAIFRIQGSIGLRGDASALQPILGVAQYVDAMTEGELLMSEVRVFGFPRIQHALDPQPLVSLPGELSAVSHNCFDNRRHFVVSSLARAGLSGGPVVLVSNPTVRASADRMKSNEGSVVAIVVSSLESRSSSHDALEIVKPLEPGLLDAISVATLGEVIAHNKLALELG